MSSGRLFVASVIAIVFSSFSFICSLLNLMLIAVMRQWNGFLAILCSMAVCQMIYDGTFYLSYDTNINYTASAWWSFFQAFGGLSVTFWTNVLSAVICYVIMTRNKFDILKYFGLLSLIVYGITLIIAVVELVCNLEGMQVCTHALTETYYWARIASIAFNFVVFGYVYWYIHGMQDGKHPRNDAEMSMFVLARRMMYYPLIQFFSRIFNAVYEELFGFSPYEGDAGSMQSMQQFIMQCIACMTQPSAGIGFLIIFLIFQPLATDHLWALLTKCSAAHVTKLRPKRSESCAPLAGVTHNSQFESEVDLSRSRHTLTNIDESLLPGYKYHDLDENDLMAIIHRESMWRLSERTERPTENSTL
jgi:hypothetical protein